MYSTARTAVGGSGAGAAASPGAAVPGGALGGVLRGQLTAFGEALKRSLRELRLTVSWKDGKRDHGFTVSTYLVVLNPRAPGGARGPDPDVPPNLAAAAAATQAATAPGGITAPPAVQPPAPSDEEPARATVRRRSARPRTPSGGDQ